MRTIRTIAEMRAWLGNARAEGRTVGLVPTMGAFHAGHHSLMRAAREEQDAVVVSLFVNPAQFNDAARPRRLPAHRGATTPPRRPSSASTCCSPRRSSEIYPRRLRHHASRSAGLGEVLEGAERGPGHFAGVCTVVTKLLNIVAARRRLLRPEGRAAGRGRQADGARPRHAGRGSRSCRPCASRTASRSPAATSASPRRPRPRARPLARACSAAGDAVAAGERDAARIRARRPAPSWATSTPSTSRSSTPLTFAPLHHGRRPARSSRSPRRSGPSA